MVEMESRVGAHYNVDATPVCPVGRKKTVFFYSSIGLLLKLRHARAQSGFRTFPEKRPALQLAAQDLLAPRRRAAKADVPATIRRMGMLPIDTISACEICCTESFAERLRAAPACADLEPPM